MIKTILIFNWVQSALLGAVFGRMDGGGVIKTPEWVERSLIMSYFVLGCLPFAGPWSLVAYTGVLGIATGHGLYFPTRSIKAAAPERVDPFVRLFFGHDPRTAPKYAQYRKLSSGQLQAEHPHIYSEIQAEMQAYGMDRLLRRCLFGMFTTGALVGLPAAVMAIYFHAWISAAFFALTGPWKAFAYWAGWKATGATEACEWINGGGRAALATSALYAAAWGLFFSGGTAF